jgi:hypothetical protein
MTNAVQFRGMDEVLKAYEFRKANAWSIWCGKDYLTKGEGKEMLADFLTMLDENGSKAIYKLKIYEDISASQVKEKTEADGSFSFLLYTKEFSEFEGTRYDGTHNKTYRELQELKKMILERDEKPEPDTIGSIGMDLLRNPGDAIQWINVIRAITGQPLLSIPQTSGAIAGIGSVDNEEQRQQRAATAIDVLEKNDPKLVSHLEKLANIATENPALFKTFITMLDK